MSQNIHQHYKQRPLISIRTQPPQSINMTKISNKTYISGFISVLLIAGVVFCIVCLQTRNAEKKQFYRFSLLPQKDGKNRLFPDDDDETTLFKTPLKLQPYYDDEHDPITDTDDESEDEIVMLNSSASKTEYHD